MIDAHAYVESADGSDEAAQRFYEPFLLWFAVGVLAVTVYLLVHLF